MLIQIAVERLCIVHDGLHHCKPITDLKPKIFYRECIRYLCDDAKFIERFVSTFSGVFSVDEERIVEIEHVVAFPYRFEIGFDAFVSRVEFASGAISVTERIGIVVFVDFCFA